MNKLLILIALTFSFNAYAVDVLQGESKTASFVAPTEYTDGTPFKANDITYQVYQDTVAVPLTVTADKFTVDTTGMAGIYSFTVTAFSAFFNTESVHSNSIELNVLVPTSPNGATQLNWD